MARFDDKVVIITGAAAGIGAEAAIEFAREGAIAIITDIDMDTAEKTAAQIRESGGRAEALYCNVSDSTSVNQMVDQVIASWHQVDILVANAGGTHGSTHAGEIEEYSDEEFDVVVKRNLYGSFFLSRKVIPYMKAQGGGKIVMVSSRAGRMISGSAVGRIPYAASKAGQLGLMRQLAQENGKYNIQINAVAPGLIKTTEYIEQFWRAIPEEEHKKRHQQLPAGRRGYPEDVAAGILYLASKEADYVIGHCLDINGGGLMM